MASINLRSNIAYVVLFFIIVGPVLVNATMLFRDTFEGDTWTPWTVNVSGSGEWDRFTEDEDNDYASQVHGDLSIWLKDPDNSSYANAFKSFDNDTTEYMVEFYLWITDDHETIDSFPLCEFSGGEPGQGESVAQTDISLYLHEAGSSFEISVEGAYGFDYNVASIDSTNRWYKVQIYHYPSGDSALVDFYLDGELIDTYSPINPNYVTNQISLGTTSDNPEANGEVFYDDFIVIDYSDKENKITVIQRMITQIEHTINVVNNRDFNHYFSIEDVFKFKTLSSFLNSNFTNLSNYKKLSYFNELVVMFE